MTDLYPDLLKRCLINWIYGDKELAIRNVAGFQLATPAPMDEHNRVCGEDWPPTAHTMIGLKRLDNLEYCINRVLHQGVPGDFIECGAWRGGASIFMRGLLKHNGVTTRRVFVADSFEGLPLPDARYPADANDTHYQHGDVLAVSLEEVRENFGRYGLLDDQVVFLKGWFKDTLPSAPITKLAILRIDGDMYESTTDALTNLYPKLSRGGFVIVDDYGVIDGCRKATDDYREQNGIKEPIVPIDRCGIFWRKLK